MKFEPVVIPGTLVDPIPEPRRIVKPLMQAVAMASGDQPLADARAESLVLANCLCLRRSRLVIAGTGCRRPLLLQEFGSVCDYAGRHGVIVRLGQDLDPANATFDIKIADREKMACAYRLWMDFAGSLACWLTPTGDEHLNFRLDIDGLTPSIGAPFQNNYERCAGLVHGANFLALGVKGQF